MRTTGWLLLATIAFCIGVWLTATGWGRPRHGVAGAMERLRRPATVQPVTGGLVGQVGHLVRRSRIGAWTDGWIGPLRLIGRPIEVHLGLLVLAGLVGLVVPSLVLGAMQWAGLMSIGVVVPFAASLVAAIVLPLVVHSDARTRSAEVAVDLRHQLGAYLDMVTMLLAGNTGYEGALEQAARAGDGVLFRQLRRRMREVSTTGRSLVRALELVADEYGIVELDQVAATATLSASEGAPVARSLGAKCSTLRSTLAAEQEAAARVRNDKLTPPLVGMALLFMALIIYPALDLT
jgi:tight adherence protein C